MSEFNSSTFKDTTEVWEETPGSKARIITNSINVWRRGVLRFEHQTCR